MNTLTFQADLPAARQYLHTIISRQASGDNLAWLDQKIAQIAEEKSRQKYFLAFGSVPRFISREMVVLEENDRQKADKIRKGLDLRGWNLTEAARTLLTLSLAGEEKSVFLGALEQVFGTADLNEQVALYKSLPLLPYPEDLVSRATEGIRTNIRNVFDAIVLDNPFPHDYLPEDAWNQMVLKAIFTERPLSRIYGLEDRSNPHLSRILSDYAHERWAAHRVVTPELWRAVGPYVDETIIKDIERLLGDPDPVHREAGALLCAQSNSAGAKALLEQHPGLRTAIKEKRLTWETIAKKCWGDL